MLIYYYRNADRLDIETLDNLVAAMPQQQRDIVAHYKTHRQRCEQAIAYAMLCHALQHGQNQIKGNQTTIKQFPLCDLRLPYAEYPLWAFGEHGKPYLTSHEGVFFNISHCKEAVALAVSDREVGVDVEGRRRFSDNLLKRSFNDEEQHAVKHSQDPEMEFAKIWTRKEAWFKYTGTGIMIEHLKTVEDDAAAADCVISTFPVTATNEGDIASPVIAINEGDSASPATDEGDSASPAVNKGDSTFWLSIAEKRRQ